MPGNWHVRFDGGPYGKGPANYGHLAIRPTQPLQGDALPSDQLLCSAGQLGRSVTTIDNSETRW
jgi:hypothetical protein